ncbi:hypothetical protein [Rhizobium sp. MHM7A]|uniref:hypothetical protein n=1 Tax=Rhizobium sp. MHM7A TaxID=2583233 RepID=UPI0011072281|nr:hypothetical protein [Rhizobium sp. MHM7A]TLX16349.1 hypothetical protein FFR93_03185 [Rhizobium sp. MHM7A]
MRFWLFVFFLMIGIWLYYLAKPYLFSSANRISGLVHKNLRKELKDTEWQMEDGRIGKFHDVEDGGKTFILILADGSNVKASYLKLNRYEKRKKYTGADDSVTEIR